MPPEPHETQLPGGCALGCVGLTMAMALMSLAMVALLAMALAVGESVVALSPDRDVPAVADR